MLNQIENLYDKPTDIEWAFADDTLYMLQARPITSYIPLPPKMMTEPNERRVLYFDAGLTDGVTINRPMRPLTIDWMFGTLRWWVKPILGPVKIDVYGDPKQSLLFGTGGRFYINLSQAMTVYSLKKAAKFQVGAQADVLLMELLANVDEDRYKADKKIPSLGWWSILKLFLRALWSSRRFIGVAISAFFRPEKFYQGYEVVIDKTVQELQQGDNSNLALREMINKLNDDLMPIISQTSLPALIPYIYYVGRLGKMFGDGSEETNQLVESLSMGFAGNEAINIGIRQYRMAKILTPADFMDLDALAQRIEERNLPAEFLMAWDAFVADYGLRGPGEMELANSRYGDDPKLALEQISYMVDSDFDPTAKQAEHVAERQQAYETLLGKVNGHKRKKLEKVYKIIDLYGPTRDTPKYLLVLHNGAVRHRALQEGQMFVNQGRIDTPEDIFWFTLDEIDAANADSNYDLRQKKKEKQPFYRQLDQVIAFPHMIDSRGRIGQVEKPAGDPNVLSGRGISRGVATGRVKVLHTPREKPVEKGDVLVAYTTDPGWTPLFVNAEAIILEVGGMLQHGGVVAREYGKPCVAGIQGITTTLQDGQLVEVDGTTGVVRILEES
jgi:pyruvate,water dikinase